MKKKKRIFLFIGFIIVIIGSIFILDHKKYTTFQEVVLDGRDKVYNISIHKLTDDLRTEAIVSIKDEEKIKKLIGKLLPIELKKVNDSNYDTGKYTMLIYYHTGCCHTTLESQQDGRLMKINGDSYKILDNLNFIKIIENENLDWDVME